MYNFVYLISQLPDMPLISYVGGGFVFASIFGIIYGWLR